MLTWLFKVLSCALETKPNNPWNKITLRLEPTPWLSRTLGLSYIHNLTDEEHAREHYWYIYERYTYVNHHTYPRNPRRSSFIKIYIETSLNYWNLSSTQKTKTEHVGPNWSPSPKASVWIRAWIYVCIGLMHSLKMELYFASHFFLK